MGVGGQDVKGLGDEGEHRQPAQVPLHIAGVQQPNGHAVAEDGEGHPSDPAERAHLREKGSADVVDEHGGDGDELQEVGVQIRFQLRSCLGDCGGGSQSAADTGEKASCVHGDSSFCFSGISIARKSGPGKRGRIF